MAFAKNLLIEAEDFLNLVVNYNELSDEGSEKQVVESYYKA